MGQWSGVRMSTSNGKKRKVQRVKRIPLGTDVMANIRPDNAVEMFKVKVRFIYQGLPTRPARYLLLGMRRPTVPEYMKKIGGITGRDTLPDFMCKLGLMMLIPFKEGRRGNAYFITEKGLEVVRSWASRDRDFHAYANAYMPFDVDDRVKIMRADIALGVTQ